MQKFLEWTTHSGQLDCTPEEAGYDSRRLEILDRHYGDLIERRKIQCAGYLLSRGGKVFAWKSLGRLSYEGDKPLLPNSLRRMYSVTKFVTAVAVMQAVEEGLLQIDLPVWRVLPEFDNPYHRKISVFHLLTHTSGIYPDAGYYQEPYLRPWYERIQKGRGDNWIKRVLRGPLPYEPGEQWHYSSAGYALLGEILARVSGKSYEQFVYDRITKPLGMNDTVFELTDGMYDNLCVTLKWEGRRNAPDNRKGLPARAGNGLYSTLPDLWKLGQAMLQMGTFRGARILGKKSVELMTRNQLDAVFAYYWGAKISNYRFGLGLSLNEASLVSPGTYSHEGAALSGLYVDPKEQFVAVFMAPPAEHFAWVPEAILNARAIMWSGIQ